MNKKLFCFTYAGGNASFFNNIENDLSEFDVIKLEYSGHGKRHKEPLYNSFDELAEDMYPIIVNNINNCDYSLFGYSMGTISLVEVLKRIVERKDIKNPSNIFLAAHEPITKNTLLTLAEDNADDWVKQRTIDFGGIPDNLINNNSFWRMYLPLYRSDYTIIGKYNFDNLSLKCGIPTSVFYSEADTKLSDMKRWSVYFTGECEYFEFTGKHFFINEYHMQIADIIRSKMNRS